MAMWQCREYRSVQTVERTPLSAGDEAARAGM